MVGRTVGSTTFAMLLVVGSGRSRIRIPLSLTSTPITGYPNRDIGRIKGVDIVTIDDKIVDGSEITTMDRAAQEVAITGSTLGKAIDTRTTGAGMTGKMTANGSHQSLGSLALAITAKVSATLAHGRTSSRSSASKIENTEIIRIKIKIKITRVTGSRMMVGRGRTGTEMAQRDLTSTFSLFLGIIRTFLRTCTV